MKKDDRIILKEKFGKIVFIDNLWNHLDGTPADILCRVQLDGEIDEKTGFPKHGEWCRLSELQKTDIKQEKMEPTTETAIKPEVSIDSFYALDIRFCKIENVEDILKNPKKPFDATENPVKAYKLLVDTGFDKRDIVTNIVHFSKDDLNGIITPFILNFPEAIIRGVKSKGMIFMIHEHELLTSATIGQVVI